MDIIQNYANNVNIPSSWTTTVKIMCVTFSYRYRNSSFLFSTWFAIPNKRFPTWHNISSCRQEQNDGSLYIDRMFPVYSKSTILLYFILGNYL
jgi:hypothetical protein